MRRVALFLAVLLSCRPRGSPPPLSVEVAGCAEMRRAGPVCWLAAPPPGAPAAALTLWLPPAPGAPRRPAEPQVRWNDRLLAVRPVPAGEGERIVVTPGRGAGRLEVRRPGAEGESRWSLRVAPAPPDPPWVGLAYRLWQSGREEDLERARRLLAAQLGGDPGGEARARSFLARFPDAEPQEARLERALAARRRAGQLRGMAYEAETLARLYLQRLDFAAAGRVLDGLDLPPWAPAEALFLVDYERAVLARETGDARGALALFRAVSARAGRLNLGANRATAEHGGALLLLDLGRFEEAEEQLDRLEGDLAGADACERQDWEANQGWARLLAREAGREAGDPLPYLRAARDQAATGRRAEPHRLLNAGLNLALAGLQSGDLAGAERELAAARRIAAAHAGIETGEERIWRQGLEARSALARGRGGAAARLYREAAEQARAGGDLESLWRADVGLARAVAPSGPTGREAALALLREAEDLVDRQALLVPWPGRARFAAQREAGARLRIEMLLAAGRTEEALRAARRSRARVPRQLEVAARIERLAGAERRAYVAAVARYREVRRRCDDPGGEEWRLSVARQAEERAARADRCRAAESALEGAISALTGGAARDPEVFRPPAPGELILAFHPLDRGWVAFAADEAGVAARRFELPAAPPTPSAAAAGDGPTGPDRAAGSRLAALLLAPFADRLRAARRVRLLPYGVLEGVDLHDLPFDGKPLVARRPVVYGLDLAPSGPPAAGAQPAPAASRQAWVLADPRGDLALSRREAEAVGAALRRLGWSIERRDGEAATVESLREALRHGLLLHYAGHARPGSSDEGGELLLAGSGRLTAAEILALERVPAWIVLDGCDTGVADRAAPGEGLGLAHALLVRGARQVIAAVRPVQDGATARLFATFDSGRGEPDLALLLQRLQARALALPPGSPERDAALSFRVYEP